MYRLFVLSSENVALYKLGQIVNQSIIYLLSRLYRFSAKVWGNSIDKDIVVKAKKTTGKSKPAETFLRI